MESDNNRNGAIIATGLLASLLSGPFRAFQCYMLAMNIGYKMVIKCIVTILHAWSLSGFDTAGESIVC